jgi:hypothetical protein
MITVLAANDFGDDLGDGVAGPVGLLIIVLLVIALVFLMRSMNKHLRRVRDDFPDDEALAQIRADALSSRTGSRSPSAGRSAASDATITRDATPRDAAPGEGPANARGQRDASGR